MKKILFTLILIPLIFISCRKEESIGKAGNDYLIGSWTNPEYKDTLVTWHKASNLVKNEPGITFKQDSSLIERKNSGWCGTPPIVTDDYNGSWNQKDSILNISVGFWGGTVDYTWKLLSLDNQKLVISVVNTQYHEAGKK